MTPDEMLNRWLDHAGFDALDFGPKLIECYQGSYRRYHTLEHLGQVLDVVDELAEAAEDLKAVRYAAWFHDAVYVIGTASELSNEERSAQLAEAVLRKIGEPEELVREVARLVRLTERHKPAPDDRNGAVLCDADLAILGGDAEAYARYREQIRAEYRRIPEPDFRKGRAAILRDLLAQPRIYRTQPAFDRYEQAARANLAAEIAALEG